MTPIEAARRKARSSFFGIAVFGLLWGVIQLIVSHNVSAFFGFASASLYAWFIRFLLTPEGPGAFLHYFVPPAPKLRPEKRS